MRDSRAKAQSSAASRIRTSRSCSTPASPQTGQPYLVLEYVDGVPIDRYCEERGLDVEAASACSSTSSTRWRTRTPTSIVHRDLKPSNVFVDAGRAGQAARFRHRQTDRGRRSAGSQRCSRAGRPRLTPEYAAPEQITGAPITTATDVYALGVLLYVLLTGEHPAGATPRSTAEMVKAIVDTPPLQPPAGDLGIIIAKALKKEAHERYGSASAFASDLRRYLNHEPIAARPDTMGYRASRFVRRHRAGVAAALVAVITLSAALYAVNRERVIAQRHFNEVRQLADKLFEMDVQVRRLPGSSTTRQLLVDTSLDYLRRLAADADNDPDLALDVGTAYLRVARVEGVAISPNLGQTEKASGHLQDAQTFIDRVLARQPNNRVARLRSAQVAHDRMVVAEPTSPGRRRVHVGPGRRPAAGALSLDRTDRSWRSRTGGHRVDERRQPLHDGRTAG